MAQVRARVDDQREARGMALGKSVVGEGVDLVVDPQRDVGGDAIRFHPADHLLTDLGHALAAALVPHRLAQEIRLARCEARRRDGDLHPLFLEERHAEGALEDRLERGMRVGDGFESRFAAQVGVDHVALDGAGADECDLDDEIVEAARLEAGEGVHLCAALDLEDADGVGAAEVVVDGLVGAVELAQVDGDAAGAAYVGEGVLHDREHAEAQQVDLDEADGVEVVFLPLDHGAVFHAGGFDRDDCPEWLLGEDEAADVDAAVTWGCVEAFDDVGEALHPWVVGVEVCAA